MVHLSQREILVIIRALTFYAMDASKEQDHNTIYEVSKMLHILSHELEVKEKEK